VSAGDTSPDDIPPKTRTKLATPCDKVKVVCRALAIAFLLAGCATPPAPPPHLPAQARPAGEYPQVSGRVVFEDGRPASHASVVIHTDGMEGDSEWRTTEWKVANDTGEFVFDVTEDGRVSIIAVVAGFVPVIRVVGDFSRASADQAIKIMVRERREGRTSTGLIVDANDRPLPGATIKLSKFVDSFDDPDEQLAIGVGRQGEYTLFLPTGSKYSLRVGHPACRDLVMSPITSETFAGGTLRLPARRGK